MAIHFTVMVLLSCLVGPVLGPWIVSWINPSQVWSDVANPVIYSPMSILVWGLTFLMFGMFFYTGWLIKMGRLDRKKELPKAWYN